MPGKPEIANYQVLARRYRPQTFGEVYGQEAIVTLLKNAIHSKKLAHAYIFSGSRGTGKTSIARVLAKAINCSALSKDFEPCNQCRSCLEIKGGYSLDVIEIDGASNRGIDEIRQINETVGYSTASGNYKIYIIDEVHMLTKEAFNALLKTLEEPPPTVKFFFATTELHKVLPTILSRCQRLNLRRPTQADIISKLEKMATDLKREVDPKVLQMIAMRAEGAFRDAESLFDQVLAFHEGAITVEKANLTLGSLSQEVFFQLDLAAEEGKLAYAFDLAAQVFDEGKDLNFFIQSLTEHYRQVLLTKLHGKGEVYAPSAAIFLKEQLLSILDLCLEAESQIRMALSPRIALEGLLLKILRMQRKIPLDHLVERLIDLEKRIVQPVSPSPAPFQVEEEQKATPEVAKPLAKAAPASQASSFSPSSPVTLTPVHDTLLQFAAVELDGKIIKK